MCVCVCETIYFYPSETRKQFYMTVVCGIIFSQNQICQFKAQTKRVSRIMYVVTNSKKKESHSLSFLHLVPETAALTSLNNLSIPPPHLQIQLPSLLTHYFEFRKIEISIITMKPHYGTGVDQASNRNEF
jgi:hypothetical protein